MPSVSGSELPVAGGGGGGGGGVSAVGGGVDPPDPPHPASINADAPPNNFKRSLAVNFIIAKNPTFDILALWPYIANED